MPPDDDVPLRTYLEQRIAAERDRSDAQYTELIAKLAALEVAARNLERAHAEAHDREHRLNDIAVQKAYETMDKRLEGMNEFRDQLRDQAATFVRRDYIDAAISGLTATVETKSRANSTRIDALERKEANLAGRLTMLGAVITFVIVLVNIALRFL